ncbi:MAG: hypothetical protein LBU13_08675 [Synergistaceae bacterium]|nr:hypothetical protein [Synergistaceae bacterium]
MLDGSVKKNRVFYPGQTHRMLQGADIIRPFMLRIIGCTVIGQTIESLEFKVTLEELPKA